MRKDSNRFPLSFGKQGFCRSVRRGVDRIVILLIQGYRTVISPIFPPSCRFYPTCSAYTMEAVKKYGAGKGTWMGVRRILRCHPGNPGGYDPVP